MLLPGHVAKPAPASDPGTPASCPKTSAQFSTGRHVPLPEQRNRAARTRSAMMNVSDDLVSVLWTSSLVKAEIAKGRLEAESIPVQLIGEGADDPFPVGPAELFVPSKFEEEARRILAQSEDGSDRY